MKKIFRRLGIGLAIVVGVVVLIGVVLYYLGTSQLGRTYDVSVETISIPSDSATLARGRYLATALCTECHGPDLSGELMIEAPGIATLYAPNITPSQTGVGVFSDEDYVRAIRHGIGPDGRAYMIMPSEVFIYWSAEDLGATIAYLKSLPPVENPLPDRRIGIGGRIMLAAGLFGDSFPASYIDHTESAPTRPEIGINAEYGAYLVRAMACTMCHGDDLMGGPPPRGIPEIGEVPPAVSGGGWSKEAFLTAITTGVKPNGDTLAATKMPWKLYRRFDREELAAIHMRLQELLRN